MNAEIESLVKLQALEVERARFNTLLAALPTETRKAEAELAAARKAEAAAQTALTTEDELRKKLDAGIDKSRKKVAHLRAQLDVVTTQAQAAALEHEIQFNADEADRQETEAFESLERTEAQEAALAAAKSLVAELAEALEKIKARAATREAEYKAELVQLATARTALRPQIPEDLLARFDRIAAKSGTGLARAENQQCTSCRMGVRPQTWNNLREGQLLSCDSCGRMLYWDPAVFAGAPERNGK